MLGSMSLKQFYEFAEDQYQNQPEDQAKKSQDQWVDEFIVNMHSCKEGFKERVFEKAKPYEMSPYDQRQHYLKEEAEKKKKAEEEAKLKQA